LRVDVIAALNIDAGSVIDEFLFKYILLPGCRKGNGDLYLIVR
jgi:hypothetical protein